ncbi:MAG: P27 family phage terminase small subunit [Burkholderiaceae bacterium]
MNTGTRSKPTALKLLAGNPGKRPLNVNEPMPRRAVPVCPDWMPAEGRKEWARTVPELDRLGLLTCVDTVVLEAFCATYAEFVETVRTGQPLKAAMLAQLRIYCVELGLTPSARSKMAAPKKDDDDEIAQFFQ